LILETLLTLYHEHFSDFHPEISCYKGVLSDVRGVSRGYSLCSFEKEYYAAKSKIFLAFNPFRFTQKN